MTKRIKYPDAPKWMKDAKKKLKVGTCYWEPFRGLTKVDEVKIDETGAGFPILTVSGSTMETHPLDGMPGLRKTEEHFLRESDFNKLLKKKMSPKAVLNRHIRYWKKIYF